MEFNVAAGIFHPFATSLVAKWWKCPSHTHTSGHGSPSDPLIRDGLIKHFI